MNRFGWIPDLPDRRDKVYRIASPVVLPPRVDLRPKMPPIWDQGSIGSCTAHSTAAQCWYLDETAPYEPSRLYIYYNTRILEGTIKWDSGATIRNSIKSVVKYGFAPETSWMYDVSKYKLKPTN